MATSSYMSTSNGYVKFYVQVITNSQNVTNNSSDVTVNVYAVRTNTGYTTSGSGTVTLTVNGQAFNSSGNYTITSSAVRIGGVTNLTVPHNADGTKTLIVSCAVNIPTIFSSSAQSYSEVLTTIARASHPTINVDGVSSTNITEADMGTTLKIYTHRASASFTHTITAVVGTTTTTIATKTATADPTYTFPIATFASQIPNNSFATCTINVQTFSGTTSIGTYSCSFKLKVPTSLKPSIGSLSLTAINGQVPSTWGILVQGKSKITATINSPSASTGATIKSISISGAGYTGTTNPYTTGFLNVTGEQTFSATITDSRNRSVTATAKSSYIYPYALPYPSNIDIFRCNASGVRDDEGTYLSIKATSNYSSCNGKNGGSVQYDYRISNGAWLKEPVTLSNNVYAIVGGGNISTDNSYEVKIVANDYFTNNPVTFPISTAYVTMDFKKGGKGIAIGKVATRDNVVDIGMLVDADNDIYANDLLARNALRTPYSYELGTGLYSWDLGTLVKTNIASTSSVMVELYVTGNSYGMTTGLDSQIQAYNYVDGNNIINASALHKGMRFNSRVFNYQGQVCFWLQSMSQFQTIRLKFCTNTQSNPYFTLSNVAMPTSGVTRLVTPKEINMLKLLGCEDPSNYAVMASRNNDADNWIRVPAYGLLPHASGGASQLGTESWNFNAGYFVNLYQGNAKVVERGANNNGAWIRYADGTQICYNSWTATISCVNKHEYTYYETKTFTFAIAFADAPLVMGQWATNSVTWAANCGASTTGCSLRVFASHAGACTGVLGFSAVGRWK